MEVIIFERLHIPKQPLYFENIKYTIVAHYKKKRGEQRSPLFLKEAL